MVILVFSLKSLAYIYILKRYPHKYYYCEYFFLWRESREEGQGALSLFPEICQHLIADRLKVGLDLIEKVPGDLWTDVHDIVQETGIKTIPKKKKCKKAKWLSQKALQIAVK